MQSVQQAEAQAKQTAVNNEKCPGCGDNLVFDPKTGGLKCPSCGTKVAISARAGEELAATGLRAVSESWHNQTHVYHCTNCNAEEVLDRREIAHVCPFCGSPSVVERDEIDALRPNCLLPFSLDKNAATQAAAKWTKKRLFAPRAFKEYLRAENLNGVYLPAFTFDTKTHSVYNGTLGKHYYENVRQNGKTVRKQRTRYFSISGAYDYFFDDLVVSATDAVPDSIMNKLLTYDYKNCVEYNDDYLYGFSALLYSRSGENCWQSAKDQAESSLRRMILSKYDYDVVESLNVNTTHSDVTYKYMLLPVYTGNYTYKNKTYPFYVNGRNGKVKGKTPLSPVRVAIAAVLGVALAVGLGVLLYFLSL